MIPNSTDPKKTVNVKRIVKVENMCRNELIDMQPFWRQRNKSTMQNTYYGDLVRRSLVCLFWISLGDEGENKR